MSVEAKTIVFVIGRRFDAPRKLVWQAFTEPERGTLDQFGAYLKDAE
jgi:uncharacterized protein YndB with AHSA1/START domain